MGNNPSNTNDADNLASPSSPPRAGEASLQQAPWNLQQASASYYYLQPSSETEPSFTVFNPFDRASNRENCPPLSEALHYDSTEAYDSGPSIETLAALYPVDFPLCFPGDERSSAAELANSYHLQFCEQWFRERTAIKLQMGDSPTPSIICTLDGLPYREEDACSPSSVSKKQEGKHAAEEQAKMDSSANASVSNEALDLEVQGSGDFVEEDAEECNSGSQQHSCRSSDEGFAAVVPLPMHMQERWQQQQWPASRAIQSANYAEYDDHALDNTIHTTIHDSSSRGHAHSICSTGGGSGNGGCGLGEHGGSTVQRSSAAAATGAVLAGTILAGMAPGKPPQQQQQQQQQEQKQYDNSLCVAHGPNANIHTAGRAPDETFEEIMMTGFALPAVCVVPHDQADAAVMQAGPLVDLHASSMQDAVGIVLQGQPAANRVVPAEVGEHGASVPAAAVHKQAGQHTAGFSASQPPAGAEACASSQQALQLAPQVHVRIDASAVRELFDQCRAWADAHSDLSLAAAAAAAGPAVLPHVLPGHVADTGAVAPLLLLGDAVSQGPLPACPTTAAAAGVAGLDTTLHPATTAQQSVQQVVTSSSSSEGGSGGAVGVAVSSGSRLQPELLTDFYIHGLSSMGGEAATTTTAAAPRMHHGHLLVGATAELAVSNAAMSVFPTAPSALYAALGSMPTPMHAAAAATDSSTAAAAATQLAAVAPVPVSATSGSGGGSLDGTGSVRRGARRSLQLQQALGATGVDAASAVDGVLAFGHIFDAQAQPQVMPGTEGPSSCAAADAAATATVAAATATDAGLHAALKVLLEQPASERHASIGVQTTEMNTAALPLAVQGSLQQQQHVQHMDGSADAASWHGSMHAGGARADALTALLRSLGQLQSAAAQLLQPEGALLQPPSALLQPDTMLLQPTPSTVSPMQPGSSMVLKLASEVMLDAHWRLDASSDGGGSHCQPPVVEQQRWQEQQELSQVQQAEAPLGLVLHQQQHAVSHGSQPHTAVTSSGPPAVHTLHDASSHASAVGPVTSSHASAVGPATSSHASAVGPVQAQQQQQQQQEGQGPGTRPAAVAVASCAAVACNGLQQQVPAAADGASQRTHVLPALMHAHAPSVVPSQLPPPGALNSPQQASYAAASAYANSVSGTDALSYYDGYKAYAPSTSTSMACETLVFSKPAAARLYESARAGLLMRQAAADRRDERTAGAEALRYNLHGGDGLNAGNESVVRGGGGPKRQRLLSPGKYSQRSGLQYTGTSSTAAHGTTSLTWAQGTTISTSTPLPGMGEFEDDAKENADGRAFPHPLSALPLVPGAFAARESSLQVLNRNPALSRFAPPSVADKATKPAAVSSRAGGRASSTLALGAFSGIGANALTGDVQAMAGPFSLRQHEQSGQMHFNLTQYNASGTSAAALSPRSLFAAPAAAYAPSSLALSQVPTGLQLDPFSAHAMDQDRMQLPPGLGAEPWAWPGQMPSLRGMPVHPPLHPMQMQMQVPYSGRGADGLFFGPAWAAGDGAALPPPEASMQDLAFSGTGWSQHQQQRLHAGLGDMLVLPSLPGVTAAGSPPEMLKRYLQSEQQASPQYPTP